VLNELWLHFSSSPNRSENLRKIQAILDEPERKVTQLFVNARQCSNPDCVLQVVKVAHTRWLSHETAVRALLECLPSVFIALFEDAHRPGPGKARAQGLTKIMASYKWLATLFMFGEGMQ